jgi:hypothetical protein
MEYEIEAEFIHEFTRNRSKGFFTINGSNVLHYENKSMSWCGISTTVRMIVLFPFQENTDRKSRLQCRFSVKMTTKILSQEHFGTITK